MFDYNSSINKSETYNLENMFKRYDVINMAADRLYHFNFERLYLLDISK